MMLPRASSGAATTAHSRTSGSVTIALLDLRAADVVAGGDDHVVAAGLVPEVAVGVAREGVAGDVPAVVDVGLPGAVVEVAAARSVP